MMMARKGFILLACLLSAAPAAGRMLLRGVDGVGGGAGHNYYARADGTAADKEHATSPDSPATAMNLAVFNASSFAVGDVVHFSARGGVYRGELVPPSDGLTLRSLAGEDVTFSAFDDFTTGWSGPDGNGEYTRAAASAVHAVYADGAALARGTHGSLAAGQWDYDAGTLYLKNNPSSYGLIEGMTRAYVMRFDGRRHCQVLGHPDHKIRLHGGGDWVPGYNKTVRVNNSTDIDFAHLDISRAIGIAVGIEVRSSPQCDISGSAFSDVANNPIWYCYDSDGGSVKNCTFSNWGDNDSGDRNAVGVYNSDVVVENCTFEPPGYRAIGIASSAGSDVAIRRVRIRGMSSSGISMSNYTTGVVESSLIRDCSREGIFLSITANAHPMNIKIRHVTLSGNGTAGWYRNIGTYSNITANASSVVEIRNCISYSPGKSHVRVYPGFVGVLTIDRTIYFPDSGTNYYYWGNTAYDSFAAWQTGSGQDAHSRVAHPLFTDPGNGDFSLTDASPAIDAGVDAGGMSDMAENPIPYGSAPDIGAYEFQGEKFAGNIYFARADGTAPDKASATSPESAPTSMSVSTFNAQSFDSADRIYFATDGGQDFEATVEANDAGVTLLPVPGQSPVLHGGSHVAGNDAGWSGPDGNGEYTHAISGEVRVLVRDGIRLSEGTHGSLAAGQWDWSGGVLYVKEAPGGYARYDYGQRNRCLNISADDVTIDGLDMKCANAWAVEANGNRVTLRNLTIDAARNNGVYLDDPGKTGDTLENVTVTQSDVAIWARGRDHLTVRNCEFYNNGPKFKASPTSAAVLNIDYDGGINSDHLVITGNHFHDNGDFSAGSTGSSIVVYSCASDGVIADNSVHDEGGTGILIERMTGAARSGIIIRDNTIDNAYAGITLVDASNCTVFRNIARNCTQANYSTGLYLRQACTGNKLYSNLVYHNGKPGYAASGGLRFDGVTGQNRAYNNTFYGNENGIVFSENWGVTSGQTVRNNIVSDVNDKAVNVMGTSTSTINYNLYDTDAAYEYHGEDSNFSEWKTASGQDPNSLEGTPAFVNAAAGDFHLTSSSDAIDRGVDTGLQSDYDGTPVPYGPAPDMGAFEYRP